MEERTLLPSVCPGRTCSYPITQLFALVKWFDVYHREMGDPAFHHGCPVLLQAAEGEGPRLHMAQFRDLIQLIEKMSGQKFDIDRVRDGRSAYS